MNDQLLLLPSQIIEQINEAVTHWTKKEYVHCLQHEEIDALWDLFLFKHRNDKTNNEITLNNKALSSRFKALVEVELSNTISMFLQHEGIEKLTPELALSLSSNKKLNLWIAEWFNNILIPAVDLLPEQYDKKSRMLAMLDDYKYDYTKIDAILKRMCE